MKLEPAQSDLRFGLLENGPVWSPPGAGPHAGPADPRASFRHCTRRQRLHALASHKAPAAITGTASSVARTSPFKNRGIVIVCMFGGAGKQKHGVVFTAQKVPTQTGSWRLAWLCVFAVDSARIVRSATAAACLAPIVRSERCPLPASQRSTYRISWTARTWTRSLRSLTQFSDGTKRPGSTCQLIMRHLKRSKAVDDRPSHPRQHVPRRHKIPHEPSGGRAEPRERPSAAHRPSSLLPYVPAW